jgi:N-acetylmuramoyl-L-alanine amidase
MKKHTIPLFVAVFSIPLLLFGVLLAAPAAAHAQSVFDGKTIVIDPGHGGYDPGTTVCPYLPESTVNLDVADRLRDKLEDSGADVVLTHGDEEGNETLPSNVSLSNSDRADIANAAGADVLVSVHHNSYSDSLTDGYLSLYGKRKKDIDFATVMQNAAYPYLENLTDWYFHDYGVRQFASGVLIKSDMPATLQEPVFLSNTLECKWVNGTLDGYEDVIRQQQIANAMYEGLVEWFTLNDETADEPHVPPGLNK